MDNDSSGQSNTLKRYFAAIDSELERAYRIANSARSKGFDPEDVVDIPLTKTLPERVESLVSSVVPQMRGSGVANRITELERQYGAQSWETAMIIAHEIAEQKFCAFATKKEAMEAGIRTGFAYSTVGIVSAPLEGFIELKIKKRADGKEYIAMIYAGPVRGAGGTAAAISLLIADYVRVKMGYSAYDATEQEISRLAVELTDYHERVTNLQYNPSEQELQFLVARLPVEIDGDPTEEIEVSNYKDVPRIESNRIRGGVCLVLSMVALKAPKLWKYLSKLPPSFGLDWNFLKEFLVIQKKMKAKQQTDDSGSKKIMPDFTYITDLVAGRPVLSYPLTAGGFRLRYGRSRASGFSAAGIHPNTLFVLDDYIATGTQLKMERPGKAAAITPCDSVEPPIVLLKDGSVIRFEHDHHKTIVDQVTEVLFLGDILISYGDFFDRAHPLVPAGYCEEWFTQELARSAAEKFGTTDPLDLSKNTGLPENLLKGLLTDALYYKPSARDALAVSAAFNVPLHPRHTYHFNALNCAQILELYSWLRQGELVFDETYLNKIILPYASSLKRMLEIIGTPHICPLGESIVLEHDEAQVFHVLFRLGEASSIDLLTNSESSLDLLQSISPIIIRDKSGTFIGARMGRPEKSKMRKLTGSPQMMFPVSAEGGRLRSLQAAISEGKITSNFPLFFCPVCKNESIYRMCISCFVKTEQRYFCKICGTIPEPKCRHGEAKTHAIKAIDIKRYFDAAVLHIGAGAYPDLIKGVRGTSNKDHVVENIAKGILRGKHELFVNKDGTIRYDMSELPITHFTPHEIGTSVSRLIELGYEKDIHGEPLTDSLQVIEIFPQDVILPNGSALSAESASDVLLRISRFVDDLLTDFYKEKKYYDLPDSSGVVGQLVVGLAPHISAGIVGRVIGFSSSSALLAHPLYHAAMRRDADGDEACVILLVDALLNFSRQFLPDSRGSRTMDAPLVLNAIILPSEVDDMAHRLDIVWQYPLALYEVAQQYKPAWDVSVELLGNRLGKPGQYEGLGFTHPISNINIGVTKSAYKTLETMEDKLRGQMKIAEKVRAVNSSDVARLVIEKHFIKDIKGNLRKFATQSFRCIGCNESYRRPPLKGKCLECNGRLIFTVSEGSIVKYLVPALSLATHYDLDQYTKQTLEITRTRIEEVFGKDTEKQEGLGKWFG